jgi:uridine kinase
MLKPLIIGIAGGSGSGKSTVARSIAEFLTTSSVAFIDMDAHYKNFPALSLDERKKRNSDHPDAFDYDLLCTHLDALGKRNSIEKPEYDFVTRLRHAERTHVGV